MNKTKKHTTRRIGQFPILALGVVIGGIGWAFFSTSTPDLIDNIYQENTLRVITRNGPTTYYMEDQKARGFEYELTKRFAKQLGVKLEIIPVNNLQSLLTTTKLGGVHIAAAGIAPTENRQQKLDFSEPYFMVDAVVVYRAGETKPRQPEDLIGKSIAIIANSSHAEMLQNLQQQYTDIEWDELQRLESIDFLEMVRDFHYDYAVVDSNEFAINRELFPSLSTGMSIGPTQPLAWAVMKGSASKNLLEKINQFLAEAKQDGSLDQLISQYFDPSNDMSRGSAHTFTRRVEDILPTFKSMFQEAADKATLPWHLVAAIAYQESHWDPKATSPTGVRGMMMLTQTTAKEMGVKNRLDPEQSLAGGLKYFSELHQRLPDRINEPDRTNFALAAYNIGMGHLEDARVITQRQGKNPDSWEDVKQHLPLLQKRRWFSKTKFGYARGQEPVDYVTNIRRFESYLKWHEISEQNRQNETGTEQLEDETMPLPLGNGIDVL